MFLGGKGNAIVGNRSVGCVVLHHDNHQRSSDDWFHFLAIDAVEFIDRNEVEVRGLSSHQAIILQRFATPFSQLHSALLVNTGQVTEINQLM